MTSLHGRTFDCPERSAKHLLDKFAGDLTTVERYIVDEQLADALRQDDYDSYLHWRCIKSICIGLAAEQRLAESLDQEQHGPTGGTTRNAEFATAA